jgi:hypothetical protein
MFYVHFEQHGSRTILSRTKFVGAQELCFSFVAFETQDWFLRHPSGPEKERKMLIMIIKTEIHSFLIWKSAHHSSIWNSISKVIWIFSLPIYINCFSLNAHFYTIIYNRVCVTSVRSSKWTILSKISSPNLVWSLTF